MSRRKTTPSVTLFPFLAVLVCAMGALILLLLVTTRRIRQQELARWEREQMAIASVDEPPVVPIPTIEPVVPDRPPAPVDDGPPLFPVLDDDYQDRLAQRLQDIETRQRAHRLALQNRDAQEQLLRARLRQEIAEHSDETRRWSTQLATLRKQAAELEQRITELESTQRDLASLKEKSDLQSQSLSKQLEDVQSRRRALVEQEQSLKKQLEQTKAPKPVTKPKFEIVAYDGASGTNRRPILIECRADGLTFAAERITLTPEQLNGFPPEKNPLRSGTEALLTYWTAQEKSSTKPGGEPYVLLIVRPGGTVGFYVARKLLEQLEHEYGYELVNAPEDIRWPDPDPGAVEACRIAVESVLSERHRIAGRTRNGRVPIAEELEYSGKDGLFHIPEIDQLQQRKGSPSLASPAWMPQRPLKNRYELGDGTADAMPSAPLRSAESPAFPSSDGVTIVPPPPAPGTPSKGTSPTGQAPRYAEVHDLRKLQPNPSGQMNPSGQTDPRGATAESRNVTADLNVTSSAPAERLPANPFETVKPGKPKGTLQRPAGRPQQDGIGIEREAIVHLRAERVEVEEVTEALTGPLDRTVLQAGLTQLLASHAAQWGEAPAPFFWKPTMKIVIHPGGNQHLPRVQELARAWGIETRQEHSLD